MPANMRVAQAGGAVSRKLVIDIINVAGELLNESTPRTPFKDGELRGKRRVRPLSKGAEVQWLAGHAAVQEAGRRAGARPFTNYTTAGTGSGFVSRYFNIGKVLDKLSRRWR